MSMAQYKLKGKDPNHSKQASVGMKSCLLYWTSCRRPSAKRDVFKRRLKWLIYRQNWYIVVTDGPRCGFWATESFLILFRWDDRRRSCCLSSSSSKELKGAWLEVWKALMCSQDCNVKCLSSMYETRLLRYNNVRSSGFSLTNMEIRGTYVVRLIVTPVNEALIRPWNVRKINCLNNWS